MAIKKVIINNTKGIHLRIAADLVKIWQRNQAKVTISCADCPSVDGCFV